jgi:antitoxin (DNA-binding transcriptional repressor) of toxin-antitoxin stability system
MRFISVRDLRARSAEVWRSLKSEREIVVTSKGKPFALLSAVDESTIEESLAALRRAKAVAAVAALQRASVTKGLSKLSPKVVEAEIAAARRSRAQ